MWFDIISKMINFLKADKSKKIKVCCRDMEEEEFCFLISKNKEIFAYDYEYSHLDFPEPIRYCPWCGTQIEVVSTDMETPIFS